MNKPEQILQMNEIQLLTIYSQRVDFIFFSVPNESFMMSTGKKHNYGMMINLKKMGMLPGAPDLCIGYQGKMWLIENKSMIGKQSNAQIVFNQKAIAAGFEYRIIRSLVEFSALCSEIGIAI